MANSKTSTATKVAPIKSVNSKKSDAKAKTVKATAKAEAKTTKAKTQTTKTAKKSDDLTPKAIKDIKGKTVQIGENYDDTAKTKTVSAASTEKKQTTKSTKGRKKIVDRPVPEVALKINEEFCGINLFFADKKYYTASDSDFMKDTLHMRWQRQSKYWYVRLRDRAQVDAVKKHFGDRLDVPTDLEDILKAVLGEDASPSKTKTTKKSASKKSGSNEFASIPF